jgi:hypothetical protein
VSLSDAKILENVRLAAGCGAKSTMLLVVALASLSATSVDDALERILRLRGEIARIDRETARPHRALAELEPELLTDPPIARMRLDVRDHELRGRLVFKGLAQQKSFIQVAALAIAGVDLSDSDAELLDEIGVIAQLADPRIWPLTVSRRIAVNGGAAGDALIAGLAALTTEQMTGLPAAGFIRFLDRVEGLVERGGTVDSVVDGVLARGERIAGVGRPVLLGIDERVPPMLDAIQRHQRAGGSSMRLMREVGSALERAKGLRVNSGGVYGALVRDLSFSADAAATFALLYFVVPLLTHSVVLPDPLA